MKRTIHFISLGCPKNRVDTEMLADRALSAGMTMTADPMAAHVIVVNTCGFIEEAKRESIDAILDLAEAKVRGRCDTLVVAGCLAERYGPELAAELPEVDHVIGLGRLEQLGAILEGRPLGGPGRRTDFPTAAHGRLEDAPRHLAFVKVGDGCSRRCSFCAIPAIRGPGRSRPASGIVREVQRLAAAGVKEINLVSQDTSAYGRDLARRTDLVMLLDMLERVRGLEWIRVLYLYPDRHLERIVTRLAAGGPVLPYADVPLQHVTDRMLKIMGRGHTSARVERLVERLRSRHPRVTLRTTFIVGHPGETEADFEALLEFMQRTRPERIGILRYSPEEGTRAFSRADRVARSTSLARLRRARAVAAHILAQHNRSLVGTPASVMVDGPSTEGPYLVDARLPSQAPEVDGKVVVARCERNPAPGSFVRVRIRKVMGADLLADVQA